MNAKELIGKTAIRTGATRLGDNSYTDTPVRILHATDTHVVTEHVLEWERRTFGSEPHVLNYTWCDDKWIDYEELMDEARGF